MSVVIDTSAIIAVITHEPHRDKLLEITKGQELIAPKSIYWEIGNVFSAMLIQKRITLEQSLICIESYKKISIKMVDIDLKTALEISDRQNIYAYDAYLIACANKYRAPLLTLDKGLILAAKNDNVTLLEVD
ncbi:MAG: type II toxin-antitoxin system VapC family toxin [Spirochaetales bacterium]|nr:type II toxin-antitoxin system VapC family toxin [Spirochaetales bacterium]